MRIKLPFTNRIFIIGFIDLDRVVIGLNSTSFCEEGRQILMLDYDELSFGGVREDCRRLQGKYGLPSFYIFKSSKGEVNRYHAYCMTCLTFNEAVMITFDSESDRNHQDCLLANKKSTLRITEKKGRGDSKIDFIMEIKGLEENKFKELIRAKDMLCGIMESV